MPKVLTFVFSFALAGFASAGENAFSLYRSTLASPSLKVHVATFDTKHGADYNYDNCWLAADLFAGQAGVSTNWWCEPGRAE